MTGEKTPAVVGRTGGGAARSYSVRSSRPTELGYKVGCELACGPRGLTASEQHGGRRAAQGLFRDPPRPAYVAHRATQSASIEGILQHNHWVGAQRDSTALRHVRHDQVCILRRSERLARSRPAQVRLREAEAE